MNEQDLQDIRAKHLARLTSEPDGNRAYLRGADLRGADLEGADLEGADLRGADLRGAYLRGAYLEGAYLEGANLEGADLRGANLEGAVICWNSHKLISEVLWRAADGDVQREMLAAFIAYKTQWCWDDFIANIEMDLLNWAMTELQQWIKDGDGAPHVLREWGK